MSSNINILIVEQVNGGKNVTGYNVLLQHYATQTVNTARVVGHAKRFRQSILLYDENGSRLTYLYDRQQQQVNICHCCECLHACMSACVYVPVRVWRAQTLVQTYAHTRHGKGTECYILFVDHFQSINHYRGVYGGQDISYIERQTATDTGCQIVNDIIKLPH